jgi:hypothetical protein
LRYLHVSTVPCSCRKLLMSRLSAEEEHHAETLETLKFAGNCARVETKAQKNIVSLRCLRYFQELIL